MLRERAERPQQSCPQAMPGMGEHSQGWSIPSLVSPSFSQQ